MLQFTLLLYNNTLLTRKPKRYPAHCYYNERVTSNRPATHTHTHTPNMSSAFHAVLAGGGRAVATAGARALLQIPVIPGDLVDAPQDATPTLIADVSTDSTPALDSGDAAWMMTSTALVLMMSIPGLSLFYGGLVRAKNVLNVVSSASLRSLRATPGVFLSSFPPSPSARTQHLYIQRRIEYLQPSDRLCLVAPPYPFFFSSPSAVARGSI